MPGELAHRSGPAVTRAPRAAYRASSRVPAGTATRGSSRAASRGSSRAAARGSSGTATRGSSRAAARTADRAAGVLASEDRGPGDEAFAPDPSRASGGDRSDHAEGPIRRLTRAVDDVIALDIDALGVPEVEQALRAVQPQIDRLHAHRSRLAATLAERAAAARRDRAGGSDDRAQDRGDRDAQDFLRNDLNLTHREAKGALLNGRAAQDGSATGDAFANGDLRPEQVSIINELLQGLAPEHREQLERELLTAARELDAVALGRLGRRRVLELAPEDGTDREEAQHRQRAFRLAQAADGAVIPSGRLYGAQAEAALAAWHAFRRPDAKGEQRTPDQRGADAFEQLCAVALRSGDAATRHGERPQLLVVADQHTIAEGDGVVELGFTGPISLRSVRLLLSDCVLSRIGLDGEGVAVEVTRKVRTVPAGLWRTLVARDRVCTWIGCDAPAGWCDVSHGDQAYTDGGRLTPDSAALLCRRHHRLFDHGHYRRHIVGGVVSYERLSPDEVAEVSASPKGHASLGNSAGAAHPSDRAHPPDPPHRAQPPDPPHRAQPPDPPHAPDRAHPPGSEHPTGPADPSGSPPAPADAAGSPPAPADAAGSPPAPADPSGSPPAPAGSSDQGQLGLDFGRAPSDEDDPASGRPGASDPEAGDGERGPP